MIITGPIVGKNIHGSIGHNKVVIPDAFFKAIRTDEQAIAFVMLNQSKNKNIRDCVMSIDALEELTKLDLFSDVEDEIENEIESSYRLIYWGL